MPTYHVLCKCGYDNPNFYSRMDRVGKWACPLCHEQLNQKFYPPGYFREKIAGRGDEAIHATSKREWRRKLSERGLVDVSDEIGINGSQEKTRLKPAEDKRKLREAIQEGVRKTYRESTDPDVRNATPVIAKELGIAL